MPTNLKKLKKPLRKSKSHTLGLKSFNLLYDFDAQFVIQKTNLLKSPVMRKDITQLRRLT